MQHGPLKHFHLNLNHSLALVNYNSGREATKAQKALNNCLLNNTTIMATLATDNEVSQILSSVQGNRSSANNLAKANSNADMWGGGPIITSSGVSNTTPSSFSGNVWAPNASEDQRTTPLTSFLPGDLDI